MDVEKIYDKIVDAFVNDEQLLKEQLEKIFDLFLKLSTMSRKEDVTIYLKDKTNELEIVIGRQPMLIGEGDSGFGISIKFNNMTEISSFSSVLSKPDKDLEELRKQVLEYIPKNTKKWKIILGLFKNLEEMEDIKELVEFKHKVL